MDTLLPKILKNKTGRKKRQRNILRFYHLERHRFNERSHQVPCHCWQAFQTHTPGKTIKPKYFKSGLQLYAQHCRRHIQPQLKSNLPPPNQGGWNCRGEPKNCVLDGQRNTSSILVYKCVITEGKLRKDTLSTKNLWRAKIGHGTALFIHIWGLKKEGKSQPFPGSLWKGPRPYFKETQNFQLCLLERLFILLADEKTFTHHEKRDTLKMPRHRDKWLLMRWRNPPSIYPS